LVCTKYRRLARKLYRKKRFKPIDAVKVIIDNFVNPEEFIIISWDLVT